MKLILKMAPLPKIDKCKKVLFIGPHPDDIEIGAGGLVSKLVRTGADVYFLICLDGACGTMDVNADQEELAKTRKEEAITSSKFLGVKDIFFLDYPDGGKYEVSDLRVDIAKIIIDVKPDLVVSPSPLLHTETHMDHLRVGEAARQSLLISEYPLVAKRQGIDISNIKEFPKGIALAYYYTAKVNQRIRIKKVDLENQLASLKYHKSQPDSEDPNLVKYIKYRAFTNGLKKCSRYGEAYYVLGPVHQHCFSENI